MDKRQLTMKINYKDIYVTEDFEESQEFRYEHNDKPVEVGTAVAYDVYKIGSVFNGHPSRPVKDTHELTCFEGIYYQPNNI